MIGIKSGLPLYVERERLVKSEIEIYNFDNFKIENKSMSFTGRSQKYQIVRRTPCVIIVPEADDGFIMVNEFRPAIDDYILQFPAGKIDLGEDSYQAAKRELLEETGYKCDELIEIGNFYTAAHFSDEIIFAFVARNLDFYGQTLTKREVIEAEHIDRKNIEKRLYGGDKLDAKSIAAYNLWKKWKGKDL